MYSLYFQKTLWRLQLRCCRHVYQFRRYKLFTFSIQTTTTNLLQRQPFLLITLAQTMSASITIWFILSLSFWKRDQLYKEYFLKSLMSSGQAIANLTFYPFEWTLNVFIASFSCSPLLFIILLMPQKHKHFFSFQYSGCKKNYFPEICTLLSSSSNG